MLRDDLLFEQLNLSIPELKEALQKHLEFAKIFLDFGEISF